MKEKTLLIPVLELLALPYNKRGFDNQDWYIGKRHGFCERSFSNSCKMFLVLPWGDSASLWAWPLASFFFTSILGSVREFMEELLLFQLYKRQHVKKIWASLSEDSIRGRSQMTSAKFLGFWTPSPPCQYQIHATSLPLFRYWPTSSLPLSTNVICEWPQMQT